MKRLSIIIVTYKSEHDIYDCLQSIWIYSDLPKEEMEVIVVDNSPESDEMFSRLRTLYGDNIILIKNSYNGGYGQGNNVGILQATAPIIMIMNPDVRLIEPVFKTALEAFDHDKSLCIYGMKQMHSEQRKSHLSFDCSFRINGFIRAFTIPLCNRLDWYWPRWMYFSGACFFIHREKFKEAGLFDEDIFMYGEEDDIHWRLAQTYGHHFTYNKDLHYLHLILNRPLSLVTLQTMLSSYIISGNKKGFPTIKTIRNTLYYTRILYYHSRLRKKQNKDYSETLRTFITIMKEQLKNEKNTINFRH